VEYCGELWGNTYFYRRLFIIMCMVRFLGNIEAKMDAKGRLFTPHNSEDSYNPLPKKDLLCAKMSSKIA
jgi:hypothetical protein